MMKRLKWLINKSRTFLSGEGQVCGVIRWDKTNVLLQHVRDDVNHMEIVLFYFVNGQVVRENVGEHYANVLLRDDQP